MLLFFDKNVINIYNKTQQIARLNFFRCGNIRCWHPPNSLASGMLIYTSKKILLNYVYDSDNY